MAQRSVYHITGKRGEGWNVKKEGAERSSGKFPVKTEAIERGKELAKGAPKGQIKIHKGNGKIQTEHTYGKDPYPPKG